MVELLSQYETILSPLHYEIEQFVEDVVPTSEEKLFLEDLVSLMDQHTADLLGRRAKVEPFGSYAMGLSTHSSDLDLVILNVMRVHSSGFRVEQKARAIKILYRLAKNIVASKSIHLTQMRVVATARVPVLKMGTKDGTSIDLCLNSGAAIKAAQHVQKKLKEFPPSIPVILVVKCLLKEAKLNDVAFGGLGGYALANMVLVHCMELRKMGRPDLDYGEVLLGFLDKFGYNFDIIRQAVSSRRGEVIKKRVLEKETLEWVRNTDAWQGRTNGKPKLLVEDPLTGRNLAVGTSRFHQIQRRFREAFDALDGELGNLDEVLPRVFDVDQAISRNGGSGVYNPMWSVKKALKREGVDRRQARENIQHFKKREPYRQPRRGKRRFKRPVQNLLSPNCFVRQFCPC